MTNNSFKILILAFCICALWPSSASCFPPYIVIPETVTTEDLTKILHEDPTNRKIASLQIYISRRSYEDEHPAGGNFRPAPFDGIARQWWFTLHGSNWQQYEFQLPNEQAYKDLIQLCIDNEICEMQTDESSNFTYQQDYCLISISRFNAESNIAYNTRTEESEPFWEVVDYIEQHFVAPALQNPVDHWWWEEE